MAVQIFKILSLIVNFSSVQLSITKSDQKYPILKSVKLCNVSKVYYSLSSLKFFSLDTHADQIIGNGGNSLFIKCIWETSI